MSQGTVRQEKAFGGCPVAPPSLELSFTGDMDSWLLSNTKTTLQAAGKDYYWSSFFLFGIWSLQLQINKKAFKQQATKPNLLKYVEMQVRDYLYC